MVNRRGASRLSWARGGLGAAQLLFPGRASRPLTGAPPDRRTRQVVRILGGRQLIQALATGADPTATMLAVGAAVDVIHGLTMVVLAVVDRRRRRVALGDALIAAAFAWAGVVLAAANDTDDHGSRTRVTGDAFRPRRRAMAREGRHQVGDAGGK